MPCMGMLVRMRPIRLVPCAALVVLAGCDMQRSSVVFEPSGQSGSHVVAPASRPPPPGGSYRVTKGDTLYSIAFRNKVDFRELARWNNIAEPYTIWPGQDLRLAPADHRPAVAAAAPARVAAPAGAPPVAHATPPAQGGTVLAAAPPAASSTTKAPAASPMFEPATDEPVPPPLPPDAPVSAASTVVVAGVGTLPATPSQAAKGAPPNVAAPAPSVDASTPTIIAGATRSASGITWRWPADGSLIKKFSAGDAIPGIEIAGKGGDPVRAAADGVVVYSGNGLVGYGELVIIKHSDAFLSAYGHNRKRLVKEGEHVKSGQQVAEMGNSGASRDELQFQIRKDGNPVDPLSYLPPSK
jgi:lipoprotein NlpD